jgi:spore maturation protein CgeB
MRGVARQLIRLGHDACFPAHGTDLDAALNGVDIVIVEEGVAPDLMAALGRRRLAGGRFTLLFRDAGHGTPTGSLEAYDGVLAAAESVSEPRLAEGWGRQVFTWHEGVDIELFRPVPGQPKIMDLIWIGGRDAVDYADLRKFLLLPVARLGLKACVHGAPAPIATGAGLAEAGIRDGGWLPNRLVTVAYAGALMTVNLPPAPETLPGIPSSRLFEALACGIPLVSGPWHDTDGLFPPGCYLKADDGAEMIASLSLLRHGHDLRDELISNGLDAIEAQHSCGHRAEELLWILERLQGRMQIRAAQRAAAGGHSAGLR